MVVVGKTVICWFERCGLSIDWVSHGVISRFERLCEIGADSTRWLEEGNTTTDYKLMHCYRKMHEYEVHIIEQNKL